jgi:hypothetical protein
MPHPAPRSNIGRFLPSLTDVANGFLLEILEFETGTKPLGALYSTSSSSTRETGPSFSCYESLDCSGCRLHLKAQTR